MIRKVWTAAAVMLALSVTGVGPATAQQGPQSKPAMAEPSLSPDGREIAFVSGGDIWTVPAAGGVAHLLVSDPATESRPLYSPDGSELAFTSTRNGPTNIYVLTLASGAIRRLTFTDVAAQLDAWSRDGRWIYFSSSVTDIAGQNDIFRVSSRGGSPLEVSRERFLNEFNAPNALILPFPRRRIITAPQGDGEGAKACDLRGLEVRSSGKRSSAAVCSQGGPRPASLWSRPGLEHKNGVGCKGWRGSRRAVTPAARDGASWASPSRRGPRPARSEQGRSPDAPG